MAGDKRRVRCIVLLFGVGLGLAAQTGFRAEGRLVLVNAGVYDDRNRFHGELGVANFEVTDEGRAVRLESVGVEEVAISTVIVLDVSRSMGKHVAEAREALGHFLAKARMGDEFCLLVFAEEVAEGCAFTGDAAAVRAEAVRATAGGGTALGDALLRGMGMVKRARNARRAILVISDGLDNSSAHSWKEVRRATLETNAVLYVVSLPVWREQDAWRALRLQGLAEESGGRMLTAENAKELPGMVERLEVRQQYVLAFAPVAGVGRHAVRVRLRGEAARHLRVYWRRSYVMAGN